MTWLGRDRVTLGCLFPIGKEATTLLRFWEKPNNRRPFVTLHREIQEERGARPMADAHHAGAHRHFRVLFEVGTVVGLTDEQLLCLFVTRRDEAAFTALIERHGPMVQRVCRDVLGDHHDAQDAFQATFLVLAKQASSIRRRDALASWLYGVALRVGLCTDQPPRVGGGMSGTGPLCGRRGQAMRKTAGKAANRFCTRRSASFPSGFAHW